MGNAIVQIVFGAYFFVHNWVCGKRFFDKELWKYACSFGIVLIPHYLASMKLAGYIGCPKDSCLEILNIADYVSDKNGGQGAVRDVIEHFLRETGEWEKAVAQVYGIGV